MDERDFILLHLLYLNSLYLVATSPTYHILYLSACARADNTAFCEYVLYYRLHN